ncbi:MAG: endonuclease/exonuclease/phosphatase family protein [Proteobacteria bacterium]|nr:endonuclease/exonuclease/phosphatase family protein [Pseudomonadota bacterium]
MGPNLRVVTINFWGTEAPLERRLALAIRQLRALAPDVICMQEVKPHAGGTTADAIAAALGMTARYGVAVRWDGGEEGLAILARSIGPTAERALPEARPRDARLLLSAQVDTSGGPIWVHTTHLHYRLDDGVAREQQVLAVDAAIRGMGRENTDSPQILCGDFNATPDSDEIRFLRGLTTLGGRRTHFQDAWLRRHGEVPAGLTWSSENELTRPLRSLDIDRRIDFVFVTSRKKDGRGTIHDARVVLAEREDVDGHGSICASDHYAVMADVQVVPSATAR